MTHTTPKEAFDHVIRTVGERLKPLGFARRGQVLRIAGKDTCGVVEFQRSTQDTRDKLLFTINLGIVCGDLLGPGPAGLREARVVDAHVRERIGLLLPEHADKWWEITAATDPNALAQEVSGLILKVVVPYAQRYLSTDAIISLWESGKSPGLTNKRRVDLLAALKMRRQERTPDAAESSQAPE